jgi:hypothetical protein
MNFNGSGGLMFLIIAGLWVWVFVPTWFKRSQEKQLEKSSSIATRAEIKNVRAASTKSSISKLAEQNFRLTMTQRIFTGLAFFAFAGVISSIFMAVSQIFYLIFSAIFSAIFVASIAIVRAAKRKNSDIIIAATRNRSSLYASVSNALKSQGVEGSIAGNPVDKRAWEPNRLPAPRQRIGELEMPTLAEVVEIEERAVKKTHATLDSSALDEILRRRRANG